MKKKLFVGAIAIAIAGLLISSATGMLLSTQNIVADQEQNIQAYGNQDGIIAQFINDPSSFRTAEFVSHSDMQAAAALSMQTMDAQTVSMMSTPSRQTTLGAGSSYEKLREDIDLKQANPSVGDRQTFDQMMLAFEQKYDDGMIEEQLLGYIGTDNFVSFNLSNVIGFIDSDTQTFLKRTQPSMGYFGEVEDGGVVYDRWYTTFRPDPVVEHTGQTNLLWFDTTEDTITDLLNANVEGVYWDWSQHGFSDLTQPTLALTNVYSDAFWGVMVFGMQCSEPYLSPAYTYQTNDTGYASLLHWSLQAQPGPHRKGANDASIDMYDHAHVMMTWGAIWTTGAYCWMVHYNDMPEFNNNQASGWGDHTNQRWRYVTPSTVTYNSQIFVAMEAYNSSSDPTGSNREVLVIRHGDGDTGSLITDAIAGWYWEDGTLINPVIEHVQGETYVLTVMAVSNIDPDDSTVLIGVTYNGGYDWDGLYYLSNPDEPVLTTGLDVFQGGRPMDISKGGYKAIWSSFFDTGDPSDLVYLVDMIPLAVGLTGEATTVEGYDAPITAITVENLDTGAEIPGVGVDYNTYFSKILIGFDLWFDETLKVSVDTTEGSGDAQQLFDVIYYLNVLDIVVDDEYPPVPGDINGDGCVNLADLGILLAAWNSFPGDPNWNPDADIDGDGHVHLGDLGILLANWMQGWGC